MAKLIVNTIQCDSIIINASDENNVDMVRNKVKGFASTVGFKDIKIIILDEFDYMTPNAQAILRNLMETFSKHCRFILTCNYVERVIPAIQSRCQTFQIIPPSKKEVAMQLNSILLKEKIQFSLPDLVPIIDSVYPDIRKIINTCQLNSSKGVLKVNVSSIIDSDVKTKLVEILSSKLDSRNMYVNSRQLIADSGIQDFAELYTYLYEKVDVFADGNTAGIIIANPPATNMDVMVNLANPMGSSKYQQLFDSEFGSDLLGATTITTNATSNSWSNSTDWSSMTEYTVIIISKYNDPSNNQENTFTNLGGPVTFNFGNGTNDGIGKINLCILNGDVLYAGDATNILWAMYTLCGSTTIKLNFYRKYSLEIYLYGCNMD